MRSRLTTLFAVIGAATVLVLAANTLALAATGKALIQGHTNKSAKATTIQRTKAGPALKLKVKKSAPLTVNSTRKVKHLNADLLDGRSATAFATTGQTALARRLVGVGTVHDNGSTAEGSTFPGRVSRAGTGIYSLTIPRYSKGCKKTFPVLIVTPQYGPAFVTITSQTNDCTSGDVTAYLKTSDSAGDPANEGFGLLIFEGTRKPSARRVAGNTPTSCVQDKNGVSCH